MNEKKDLISIVIANYNSKLYLHDTINSIITQTYKNFELIIVDDNSTDNSIEIIEKFKEEYKEINLIKLDKNMGPAIARNKGIKEAKGKYLTFIDSDDLWDNNFLERSMGFLKENKYSFVFSSYRRTNENLVKLYADYIVPKKVNYNDLLKSNRISCLTAFIDISQVGKMYMNETFKSHEDYSLWLQVLKKEEYAYGMEEVLATYRIRKDSLSRNKLTMIITQWKFLRKVENLSLYKSFYYLLCYLYNGIKKYT